MNLNVTCNHGFLEKVADIGTEVELIPGGYTCVLQPLDVGLNKPLKFSIREIYIQWAADKYISLSNGEKFVVPTRKDITDWIKSAWAVSISAEMIFKTFQHIGFSF